MTAGEQLRICSGCGIIAPSDRQECEQCGAALASALTTRRLLDSDRYWVGLQVWFVCRVCGHDSPINHLDADGSVLCLRCGIEQKWEPKRWRGPIRHAHAVGDLAGPQPEGLFPDDSVSVEPCNHYKDIGTTDTWAELQQNKGLRVRAAPGAPLCRDCHQPLTIKGRSASRINLRCDGCNSESSYQVPSQLQNEVRGVIASEHAIDSKDVKVEASAGGAVAISCPHCNAALEVSGESTIVKCGYCNVSSRIAAPTMRQLGFNNPEAELWWVLLEGPSTKRNELVSRIRKDERKREAAENKRHKQQEKEQQRQRQQQRSAEPRQPRAKPKKNSLVFAVLAGLAISGAVVLLVTLLKVPQADDVAHWAGGDYHRSDARPLLFDVNGDGKHDIVGLYSPSSSAGWYVGAFEPRTLKELWTVGPFKARMVRRYLYAVGGHAVLRDDDDNFFVIDMKSGRRAAPIRINAREVRIVAPAPGATKLALNVRESNRLECRLLDPASGKLEPAADAACQAVAKAPTNHAPKIALDDCTAPIVVADGKLLFASCGRQLRILRHSDSKLLGVLGKK